MSISALLSNTDEPSTDTTTPKNIPRLTQPTKRRSPDRDSNNTSPAMSRASLRQAPPAKPATASASSFRSGDADATDTEPGFSNHGGSGGKNGSFRGFRYHDSVNLLTDDPDKTDSELDDGGFAHERAEYLKKIRKRRLEVEGRENENRKVRLHSDASRWQILTRIASACRFSKSSSRPISRSCQIFSRTRPHSVL